jgi:ABC-type glycerol-3-phosphate transport system permease component
MKTRSGIRVRTAVLSYLVVLISLLFFVGPMLWIAYTSFRVESSIFSESVLSPANEYTLQNYQTVLSVTDFPRYFLNSLQIGLTVTAFSLFVSIIGAYGLSRFDVKGKNALIIGIFSTQMFPQVLLMIPIYLVIVALGMLNRVIGVVLGQMILILPFQIWMLKGYFDGLPREIDDAAQIDGTNIAQRLLLVILPVASPGVAVAAFYSFVVSWGDYLIVSIVSQGNATATVTLAIQRLTASLLVRWGQVAAITVLAIVPTILLFSFVQGRLVEGLTAGAIKEG